jgi:RNA polymerase sigma-70 factor (sigma-E family)
VTPDGDAEFTEFAETAVPALRRLAYVLCHDWHSADDLVQATITRLYVRWPKASAVENLTAYVRTMLFREFLHERRSGWARRVDVTDELPAAAAFVPDRETAIDLDAALRRLPPRQRATQVLRYHCDLTVEQTAEVLGCSQGNVKSQTARALASVRKSFPSDSSPSADPRAEVTDNA